MSMKMILGLFIPIVLVFFSGVFAILWHRKRDAIHVLAVAIAFFMTAVGFIITQMVFPKQSPFNPLIGQPVMLTAFGLMGWAACKRAGAAFPIRFFAAFIVVFVSAAVWATIVFDTVNIRSFINNLALSMSFAIGAVQLYQSRPQRRIDRALNIAFALIAAQFLCLSTVPLLTATGLTNANYHNSIYWILINVTGGLGIIIMAGAFATASILDTVEQTIERAQIDALSGLKTRQTFDDAVAEAFAKLDRTPLPVSLVLADIDHFKRINDTYGHQTGDKVIAAFGQLFQGQARETDITGRVGGEEFAILLWNAPEAGASLFAETVRTNFDSSTVADACEVEALSASFGVAERAPGEPFEALYGRVDKALYAAKDAGRNTVMTASALGTRPNAGRQQA